MNTAVHPAAERADLLIDPKRYEDARELLARRLAEDPEDVRAWGGDGENGPKVLQATERALAPDPEDLGALVVHAHALRAAHRFPETAGVPAPSPVGAVRPEVARYTTRSLS
ncbi:hypothetical protein ACPCSC_03925 [Streptomyces lavendulocolor]|uniref:hypothetical protein n=1 Tax=Streptomyces lavendulocolor TaxID=67316 RepID=UPI003C2C822C